jgi:hypothetical protein
MESSQWENWNHLFCRKFSFLTASHCQLGGVCQGMKLPPWPRWPLWNICVTNDHGYVALVVNTSRSFPHSWFITEFVTRLIRRVSIEEQELIILPVHLSSHPVFSEVGVTRSLVICLCFVDRFLSVCLFSFGHYVVWTSLIYELWLVPPYINGVGFNPVEGEQNICQLKN